MSRKRQLDSINTIAKAREDDAAREMASTLQRKSEAEQRLVELVSYRQEYENKLKVTYAQNGAYIDQIRECRAFVEKLGDAIRQQQSQILSISEQLDQQIALWRSSHANHQALSSLLQRYRKEAAANEERRTQAESEDTTLSRIPRSRL